MINIAAIEAATPVVMAAGVRQFQAFLTGADDAAHAARLLELMAPPVGAVVVDAGCGIGETARLMHQRRPDLRFVLVNLSAAQLDLCPTDMERVQADFCAMPLPDACADVVLYSYSASQCDDWRAMLGEARRVLRPGGLVFIHDLADVGGANHAAWNAAGAVVRSVDEMVRLAREAGFDVEDARLLEKGRDQLRLLMGGEEYAAFAQGIGSCAMRLRVGDGCDCGYTNAKKPSLGELVAYEDCVQA